MHTFEQFRDLKRAMYMSPKGGFSEVKDDTHTKAVIAYAEPTSIPRFPLVVRGYKTVSGRLYINAPDGSGFQHVETEKGESADETLYRAYIDWEEWCMEYQSVN